MEVLFRETVSDLHTARGQVSQDHTTSSGYQSSRVGKKVPRVRTPQHQYDAEQMQSCSVPSHLTVPACNSSCVPTVSVPTATERDPPAKIKEPIDRVSSYKPRTTPNISSCLSHHAVDPTVPQATSQGARSKRRRNSDRETAEDVKAFYEKRRATVRAFFDSHAPEH
jgi:hypothetical protein